MRAHARVRCDLYMLLIHIVVFLILSCGLLQNKSYNKINLMLSIKHLRYTLSSEVIIHLKGGGRIFLGIKSSLSSDSTTVSRSILSFQWAVFVYWCHLFTADNVQTADVFGRFSDGIKYRVKLLPFVIPT